MDYIQTDRLNLRYITTGDALFIKTLFNEPAFIKNLGMQNLIAITSSENTASIKVLNKLGFVNINAVFMAGYTDPSSVFIIRG